jgi:positive regulator of sigma E activity
MGIKAGTIVEIGAILSACLVVYLIPRLALVGAVLLTGYLGGATASNVIVGHPFFECIFPVIFGALIWVSLYLRDERVRAILAPRD